MNDSPKIDPSSQPSSKNAGGVFLALGGIVGALLGGIFGQPSLGFLAGLGSGGLIALLIWLLDRE